KELRALPEADAKAEFVDQIRPERVVVGDDEVLAENVQVAGGQQAIGAVVWNILPAPTAIELLLLADGVVDPGVIASRAGGGGHRLAKIRKEATAGEVGRRIILVQENSRHRVDAAGGYDVIGEGSAARRIDSRAAGQAGEVPGAHIGGGDRKLQQRRPRP